jgi:hypothetical protein
VLETTIEGDVESHGGRSVQARRCVVLFLLLKQKDVQHPDFPSGPPP